LDLLSFQSVNYSVVMVTALCGWYLQLEKVQTVVTPGETVDVLVTDYGIAINPKRLDLYEILQKTSLPVMTVEELHQKAQKLAGVAEKTILGDRVCGLVEYRDGTIIDVVYDLP
jgi:citrate lyase subunit alpha / citrate CoA-transferase